jgi:hypothetical protein
MRFRELFESILAQPPSSDAMYAFYDAQERELAKMVAEFRSGGAARQDWPLVPAARLIKIWKDHARMGIVRDTKGMQEIATRFYFNIVRLLNNTEVAEHGTKSKEEVLQDHMEDPEEMEAFVEWATDTDHGWRISDYGFPRLTELAFRLNDAYDAEEKLLVCDAILNVVHQRSDMASWFVEGGTRTLDAISSE